MIVKNEEKNIERALAWGKGIVDEQIVLDSGSTDRTVELAIQAGAKVFHFDWVDNFAKAKNAAISKASGDWIIFLDADEYFTEEDAKKIPSILKKFDEEIRVDYQGGKLLVNALACSLRNLDTDGSIKSEIRQIRIFRNVPYLRYVGPIHEELESITDQMVVTADLQDEVAIYHTGYAWTADLTEQKMNRNITMIQEQLKNHPDSAKYQLYLAESLMISGKIKEAAEYAKEARANMDDSLTPDRQEKAYQVALYGTYLTWKKSKDQPQQAIDHEITQLYREALLFAPTNPEYDAIMGRYLFGCGRYAESVRYLETTFEKINRMPVFRPGTMTSNLAELYQMAAFSYSCIKNEVQAFVYAGRALQLEPHSEAMTELVLNSLTYVEPASAEEIIDYLKRFYDFTNQKDVLYLLRIALRVRNVGLAEMLKNNLSEENKKQLFPNG
jgi:glycosyltransferase involved in cell wall biosynthesis